MYLYHSYSKQHCFYCRELVLLASMLDKTRPVTIVYGISDYGEDMTVRIFTVTVHFLI